MAQSQDTDHIERARRYLAIAESQDSKREAYKQAAEEIAAHKAETGDSDVAIAIAIGWDEQGRQRVERIRRWRDAGYPEGTTPFTMADPSGSKPTDRAAVSHTKRVLREAEPEQMEELVKDLPDEQKRALVEAVEPERKRAREFAEGREPVPVKPSPALEVYRAESELRSAINHIGRFIRTISAVNQPGDDEDIIELLDRGAKMFEVARETYLTGKSIDTWAYELTKEAE